MELLLHIDRYHRDQRASYHNERSGPGTMAFIRQWTNCENRRRREQARRGERSSSCGKTPSTCNILCLRTPRSHSPCVLHLCSSVRSPTIRAFRDPCAPRQRHARAKILSTLHPYIVEEPQTAAWEHQPRECAPPAADRFAAAPARGCRSASRAVVGTLPKCCFAVCQQRLPPVRCQRNVSQQLRRRAQVVATVMRSARAMSMSGLQKSLRKMATSGQRGQSINGVNFRICQIDGCTILINDLHN